jgi:hypothetical protein
MITTWPGLDDPARDTVIVRLPRLLRLQQQQLQVLGGIQLEEDMIMISIMIIILFARRYRVYCNVH